ncbi:MAG: hypothetical protein WKF84_15720 [Pyrinomonadaceae bacterium]
MSVVGLDEWALEELNVIQKRLPLSPAVNLALARIYRSVDDNVTAFNALRRSFPDYSQMEPEELTPEQWDIFYPLSHWDIIVAQARAHSLDPHQVAGLIRQESVFNRVLALPRTRLRPDASGVAYSPHGRAETWLRRTDHRRDAV